MPKFVLFLTLRNFPSSLESTCEDVSHPTLILGWEVSKLFPWSGQGYGSWSTRGGCDDQVAAPGISITKKSGIPALSHLRAALLQRRGSKAPLLEGSVAFLPFQKHLRAAKCSSMRLWMSSFWHRTEFSSFKRAPVVGAFFVCLFFWALIVLPRFGTDGAQGPTSWHTAWLSGLNNRHVVMQIKIILGLELAGARLIYSHLDFTKIHCWGLGLHRVWRADNSNSPGTKEMVI